ncbi:hypothetical protein RYZ20_08090 [Thioclava sp. A2]|uniref:hypothetical protein n=1 Tax=Thioclava sp. FCG-A2 TaxID=3080562 RepID=UPI002953D693|nr:hypothetical protein [Thioclava sp. A2]MDV7270861.1 hypothetical protein [Thioclava sp. A2]
MLLQVMETRAAKVQATTLRQVSPRATDQLVEAELLVASGHIPVVTAMDHFEDEPIPAEWCAERRQYGYTNSVGRWVAVDAAEIAALAVDYQRVFAKMLVGFERVAPARPVSLIDGFAWDIGTIRLAGAKSPVPIWFARRLADPAVWQPVDARFSRQQPDEVRVILTSTLGDRIPITVNKRNVVINVADVAIAPGKLAISPAALGARVFPGHVQRKFPIDHSDGCGIVWHRGEMLTFGGDKQRLLLQLLFAAYEVKSPVLRVAHVLEEAGYGGQVNTLKKAFGRRTDWQRFIKFDDGNCWIEP